MMHLDKNGVEIRVGDELGFGSIHGTVESVDGKYPRMTNGQSWDCRHGVEIICRASGLSPEKLSYAPRDTIPSPSPASPAGTPWPLHDHIGDGKSRCGAKVECLTALTGLRERVTCVACLGASVNAPSCPRCGSSLSGADCYDAGCRQIQRFADAYKAQERKPADLPIGTVSMPNVAELRSLTGCEPVDVFGRDQPVIWEAFGGTAWMVLVKNREVHVLRISMKEIEAEGRNLEPGLPPRKRDALAFRSLVIRKAKAL